MLDAEVNTIKSSRKFGGCSHAFTLALASRWSVARNKRGVYDERARLVILCLAVALGSKRDPHSGDLGFSVNAFKRLVAETGLMSKGRAGALLGYLRLIGWLKSDFEPGVGKRLILRSTNEIVSYAADGWRASYGAASGLLPEDKRLPGSVSADEQVIEFIKLFASRYLEGWRPFQDLEALNLFWKMRGGLPVLFRIHSLGATETVSALDLSKRFSMPRTQANLIIRKGIKAGHLIRSDGRLYLGEQLQAELETGIARFMAMILTTAHEDLLEIMAQSESRSS